MESARDGDENEEEEDGDENRRSCILMRMKKTIWAVS